VKFSILAILIAEHTLVERARLEEPHFDTRGASPKHFN
jgi:hypothetical protein